MLSRGRLQPRAPGAAHMAAAARAQTGRAGPERHPPRALAARPGVDAATAEGAHVSVPRGVGVFVRKRPHGRWGVFIGDDTGVAVLLGEGHTRPVALDLAQQLLHDLLRLVDRLEWNEPVS